jgi:precorrin-6A/cobalt-precorrin-6A reductase
VSRPLRLLLLGGSAEAGVIAGRLAGRPEVALVTSLAGVTVRPALPAGAVRIGGFSGADGLAGYLAAERVEAVLDATHPYAARMSAIAAEVCGRLGLKLLVVRRPAWARRPGDRWMEPGSLEEAAAMVGSLGQRAFLAIGRRGLAPFAGLDGMWFLIRCIDPPSPPLPAARHVVLARGPFALEAELDLLREHAVDVMVSKNSGGPAGYAKIAAARRLGLPVVLVRRPPPPPAPCVTTAEEAVAWVRRMAAYPDAP